MEPWKEIMRRRELLKMAGAGVAAAMVPVAAAGLDPMPFTAEAPLSLGVGLGAGWLNVRQFGARGDGAATDSPAINRAIDAAAAAGGGTVYLSAGVYLSYSIRLKSKVGLYLDHGAVILAGPTSLDGRSEEHTSELQSPCNL